VQPAERADVVGEHGRRIVGHEDLVEHLVADAVGEASGRRGGSRRPRFGSGSGCRYRCRCGRAIARITISDGLDDSVDDSGTPCNAAADNCTVDDLTRDLDLAAAVAPFLRLGRPIQPLHVDVL
jgi:hypothetical protein